MEMLFAMLFSCILGYANVPPRLCDDFSDADLLHQIPWTGDTGDFIVNENFQLQLNAPSGGRSAIFFGMPFLQEMQCKHKQPFGTRACMLSSPRLCNLAYV